MREAQLASGDFAMPLSLGLELLTTFSRHVDDPPPKVRKAEAPAAKPATAGASAAPASKVNPAKAQASRLAWLVRMEVSVEAFRV